MPGKRPDYAVSIVVATEGERDRWRQIGAAFITALLDALPLTGRLVLLPTEEVRCGVSASVSPKKSDGLKSRRP